MAENREIFSTIYEIYFQQFMFFFQAKKDHVYFFLWRYFTIYSAHLKKAQLFSVSILLSRSQTASSNSSAIWSYAKPQSHNRQNLKIISAYYLYTWNSFRYYYARLLFFHCADYVDMALHYTICPFYRAMWIKNGFLAND